MDKVSKTPRTDAHCKQIIDDALGLEYAATELQYWAEKLEEELAAQNKPCTDAKEQEHGCLRAVKAENELTAQKEQLRLCNVDQFSTAAELAEQKEQFRVLTDEMLVMMDERNAAQKYAERYRWLRAQSWSCSPLAVVTKPIEAIKLGYDCPSRNRLDALIDDSMREGK